MSLKDLFKETGFKFISNSSLNDLTASGIESPEYVKAYLEDRNRFIPIVDYSKPENFARFGSAEKYYYDSITRVYKTYPYDGSKKEKIFWELSSSGLDLYIFENDYPRTTGYAVFTDEMLTATDTSTNYSKWGSYGAAGTASYEFISFNGGPHEGTGRKVYIDPDSGKARYRKDANIYDISKNRECNLKIGGNDGNTVEFWLKKGAFNPAATQTEVIFDIFTTSSISSSADYGRLTLEMSGHGVKTNTLSPFYVTYMSGTAGISKQNIGVSLTTSSVADDRWHHYSFRFKNDGSDISVDLFVDGFFNDNIKTGTPINYVSGTLVGTIGALATNPSGTHAGAPQAEKGWGKLSGSLDEFRFWKVWRTSKEIQTRWFDQVGGGTNSDDANTELGLYYKFNEGITLTSSVDLKVLDYSGRVSNGTWTGYSSVYSRETGSAINESGLTSFTGSEFRDPILYSFHPSVSSLLDDKRKEGKEYDYRNPSTMYYTMPGWILDEHDADTTANEGIIANSLWNLTQILSSYFDDTANFIKNVPALINTEYFSGSEKPIPFMNRILESKGFIAPEIFNALDALEDLDNRDNNSLYTKKISDVKNIIYKNIYNNLTYINKSKGTEKSFRNLIRCFGIDDEIYKLNLYSNNVDFLLKDKFRSISNRYSVIDFNHIDHSDATVYQYSSSANSNSTTFISASKDFNTGSSQEKGFPFTVETSVVFPKKVSEADWRRKTSKSNEFENYYSLMQTASLFGMHTAIDTTPAQTTWAENDYANFVVKSLKPDLFSDKAKFVLTGTAGYSLPVLSSSLINSVYDDSDFNFMVSLYPEAYSQADEVGGTILNKRAIGTNILLSFTGQAANDRFKINVPVAAGGTGNDITIRLIEVGTPSAATPNEIQVKGTAPLAVNPTATRIAAAINGSSDTSIIAYGSGAGDATNGIAGISAAIGSTPDDITIKADITGSIGNSITLTDIEGTFVEDGATGASPATLTGGALGNTRYVVEFAGVKKVLDITIDEFSVTGTISQQDAINFLASPKRLFVGAHRTNFTGSLLESSDVKSNSIRAWQNKLSMDDLRVHASAPNNFSIRNPHQNAYLFNTELNGVFVPNQETLLLHWGFNNVTGSDATGKFIVDDLTSGSSEQIPRYGFLNDIKNKQFTGRGEFFQTSSAEVFEVEQLITAKQNLPETINSDDTVQVLSNDDIYFTRDSRPTFFDLYLEKSPYQNISEEMLGFLSTAVDYNNLIGQGVDKYRSDYKELQLLRTMFFKNIKNTPDLDKYVEYFKWFDLAVSAMIQKIAPMSSGLDERPLRNIIESHIFERNKYDLKFPSYEFKQSDPEARLFGINELLYPWKEGHAPLSQDQSDNCLWSKERGERSDELLTSGDSNVDSDRQEILDVINNLNNATPPNLSDGTNTYQGSTYALRRFARPYKIKAENQQQLHGGGNAYENRNTSFWDSIRKLTTPTGGEEGALITIEPPTSSLEEFKDCNDNLELNKGKRKFKFSVGVSINDAPSSSDIFKGNLVFPFSLYSSSVTDNPAMGIGLPRFKSNLAITNLHHDSYGPFNDVPMQGPFTEKYVGGRAYRHVMTNLTPDNNPPDSEGERLEGWRLTGSSTVLDLLNVSVHNPKSVYFRDEYAKRPVNIKNIRQLTGAAETGDQFTDASSVTKIGNYTNTYEIVMTNGRSINNRYLAESDGNLDTTAISSFYVSGAIEFALPRRDLTGSNKAIIVNRFSAPGDPATMGEGLLDLAAAEFSVYNALPFRNLSVRMPLNELHSNHTNQFGLFSDQFTVAAYEIAGKTYPGGSSSIDDPDANLNYIGTGSFHKVNRNGRLQPYIDKEHLDTYTNTKLLNFDGTNHFVNIGTAATWDNLIGNGAGSNQKFTLSAWIHPTQLDHAGGGNVPRIFDFGDQDIALLIESDGNLQFNNKYIDGGVIVNGKWDTANGVIAINRWYHVAVTYNALSVDNDPVFYINGQPVTATEQTTPTGVNYGIVSQDCFIGDRASSDRHFKGFMDELSIWNDVLTPAEIKEIYDGSRNYIYRGGVGNLSNHSAVSKLISWWRSDDYSSSTTLPDSAGSNNGTLQAAAMVIDNDGSSVEILQPVIVYQEQLDKKSFDNFFVQHQIPQTDVQYSWITASLIENYAGSALFAFEQPDFSNASLASTDLTFVTRSNHVAYESSNVVFWGAAEDTLTGGRVAKYFVDFAGLNSIINEPVSSSKNVLGYPSLTYTPDNTLRGASNYVNSDTIGFVLEQDPPGTGFGPGLEAILNAINLNRGGPYAGANWKLYKKDNHPIVRAHKNENRLSYLKQQKVINANGEPVKLSGSTGVITSVIEPPITSKYKPLQHSLSIRKSPLLHSFDLDTPQPTDTVISHTYMNNIMYFTDHTIDGVNVDFDILNNKRNIKTEQQTLDVINYYLLQSDDFAQAPEFNPIKGLNSYTTKETIYPKEQYTYLKTHRQRTNYQNGFWRDSREVRSDRGIAFVEGATTENFVGFSPFLGELPLMGYNRNTYGDHSLTASIWSLDSREDFSTASPGRIKSGTFEGRVADSFADLMPPVSSSSDLAGILQNNVYPFSVYTAISGGIFSLAVIGGTTPASPPPELQFVNGLDLLPQYNRRIAGVIATDADHEFKIGDTKWEAGEQSGKAPFYDTYDEYVDDIKRIGKDHGIIPEFRISEHMDFYLNRAENGFQSIPESAYEITGSALGSTAQQGFTKEYLHTDFLKTFSLVNADYEDTSSPSKVTLSADALIKFLPYDGFYPSERTVQITKLFYDSYSASFAINGNVFKDDASSGIEFGTVLQPPVAGAMNPVWKPLFAPGILYNSIKSGIAVDYPVHLTGTHLSIIGETNQRNAKGYLKDIPRIDSDFDFRVPFEALLDPEGEMGGRPIISSEPHPSASIALTSSLSKAGKLNYKLAMNNFLASTIDFFKPNGKLSTLASLSDTDPKFANALEGSGGRGSIGFVPGKEYKMRLVCYNGQLSTKQQVSDFLSKDFTVQQLAHSASYDGNPQTCIMYAQTGSDKAGLKLQDFYGSAFGPPVKTNHGQSDGTSLTSNVRFNFSSASYEPFTPPYYDGYAHIEFTYRPEFDDDSLTSIMTQLTQSFQRSCTGLNGAPVTPNTSASNRNIRNAMQMSASFNLALVNQPSVVYDKLGNPIEIKDDDSAGTVLTIQPKWETPILNFKDVSVTVPTIGSGSIARGMWHQYGRKPAEDEGIFMQIQDLAPSELANPSLTGSLAKQLGFRQDPIKLGRVAETKKISEAIVAIPFVASLGNQLKFGIPRATIDAAIALTDEKTDLAERLSTGINEPAPEVVDMVTKMKKFVIPPHFDFVKNNTIDPFAMFIFDFSVTLKEEDLTDIWQNLSPSIGRQFQKKEASLPIEIFEPSEEKGRGLMTLFPDDTRWMVFKVKERSAYNYFAKTSDSSDDERFKFNFEFGSAFAEKASVPDYSYNWPFDFFSLIELAKIDAEVESTVKIDPPPAPPEPPPDIEPLTAPIDKSLGFDLVKSTTIAGLNLGVLAGPGGPATPGPEE